MWLSPKSCVERHEAIDRGGCVTAILCFFPLCVNAASLPNIIYMRIDIMGQLSNR